MTKLTNLLTSGMSCWGPTIPITPSDYLCSRVELFQEAAIWRQSSCQVVQEDPMRPLREAIAELVPDWDSKLPDLAKITSMEEAQEAAEAYTGSTRFGEMLDRALCGESAETILAKTAKDMVALGYLGAEVLQWAQAQAMYSLMVSFEHLPVTLMPIGAREERSASITGVVRHIGLQKVVTPRIIREAWDGLHGRQFHLTHEQKIETEKSVTTESVEKVAGRMIWDPWPFLVLHREEELDELIARVPGKVCLQEMIRQVDPNGTESLIPRPYMQVKVLASKVLHRGTIPLEVIGGLPTAPRMAARYRQAMNTPFEAVWKDILEAMDPRHLHQGQPRLWALRF